MVAFFLFLIGVTKDWEFCWSCWSNCQTKHLELCYVL